MTPFEKFLREQSEKLDAVMIGKRDPEQKLEPLYHADFTSECRGHGDYAEIEVNRLQNMTASFRKSRNPELAKLIRSELLGMLKEIDRPLSLVAPELTDKLNELIGGLK
jgi:hypothetical protein